MPNTNNTTTTNKDKVPSDLLALHLYATMAGRKINIKHIMKQSGHYQCNMLSLIQIALHQDIPVKHQKLPLKDLKQYHLPVIAYDKEKQQAYVVLRVIDNGFLIHQPDLNNDKPITKTLQELKKMWSGDIITHVDTSEQELEKTFDWRWFLPSLVRFRREFSQVVISSFMLQIFALSTPLFMQVVIDKVMSNRGVTTLDVMAIGLLCVGIFEVILGSLRQYLFSYASHRMDIALGGKLFDHLLHLPLNYFRAHHTGETAAKLRELDNIRNFLTGNTITTAIDVVFAIIFLIIMYLFSPIMSFVVMSAIPFYLLLSFVISPMLKKQMQKKSQLSSDNQSFLVETVQGIETLKSMSAEHGLKKKWEEQLAKFSLSSLKVANLSNISAQGTQLIQKLVTVATMYMGSLLVLENALTIGSLVAFNMLSARVATPIQKLAQLWQDYQQMCVSMDRLKDIMEENSEQNQGQKLTHDMIGDITCTHVSFRYPRQEQNILDDFNINIKHGEFVALIGPSGSGKTTFVRLLQRLHIAQKGHIMIDDHDIAKCHTDWIRHQIAVVLQDNQIFSATVKDNIAVGIPHTDYDDIIHYAKLAGAHDFIEKLPQSYDTMLGEKGVFLSGGQKQRIAISRAFIQQPKILIMDEATSALDAQAEMELMQSLQHVRKNKTIIMIAHRLSTIRHAERIIVLDNGKIIEDGHHDTLIKNSSGLYHHYMNQQNHAA